MSKIREIAKGETHKAAPALLELHTDTFLGLRYTRDLVMIEIALTEGRSDSLKKALPADLNRRLVETADVRPDDVVVLIADKTTAAAWRSKPSWYAVFKRDRTTRPSSSASSPSAWWPTRSSSTRDTSR